MTRFTLGRLLVLETIIRIPLISIRIFRHRARSSNRGETLDGVKNCPLFVRPADSVLNGAQKGFSPLPPTMSDALQRLSDMPSKRLPGQPVEFVHPLTLAPTVE
jgi:hypothetical protein